MIGDVVRRRLLKGIGANLYGQFVVAFTQLAGVPILLHAWGIHTYGEWLILFAIPGYLSMTDLGFSISAANDMTLHVARHDRPAALAVFQSINLLIAITGVAAFLLSFFLISLLPIGDWLHLGNLTSSEIRFALLFVCTEVLVKLLDGINHAGFRANGEFAFHTTITNTTPLLQQMAVWGVALGGYSPLTAVEALLGIRLIVVLATAILLARRHNWLKFGFEHASVSELRRLSGPAIGNIAIPLAQAMNIQGMVLVIAAVLGPILVVTFSTLRTLTRLTLQLVATISYAAEAEFAALERAATEDPLSALYSQTMRLSLWIAITAVFCLSLFGPFIVKNWTRGQVAINPALYGWLLGTVISQTIWHGALSMLKSRNKHISAAGAQVITAAGALALAGLLLRWSRNVAGAGMALFITDVMFMLFTMAATQRILGIRIVKTMADAFDPRPLRFLITKTAHD